MPAVAAIPAIVGGVSAVAGGLAQRSAAGNAGNILNQAGEAAANSQLAEGERGATQITDAGNTAAQGVLNAGNTAAGGINTATAEGQAAIRAALGGLDPYTQAGQAAIQQLLAGIQPGGAFSGGIDPSNFLNDPGIQFRINRGMRALENSAVSRGALGSNTAQGITQFAQGVASEEYQNAFNRALASRQAQLSPLQFLAGQGLTATGQRIQGEGAAAGLGLQGANASGNFLTGAAQTAGGMQLGAAQGAAGLRSANTAQANQFRTDAASARAGAQVGRGNALAGMFGNIAGVASQTDWGNVFRRRRPASPGVDLGDYNIFSQTQGRP